MRGISPKKIPSLVARDVQLVKKEAKVVIQVSQTRMENVWRNEDGRLGVIAIIGPGEFQGKFYAEAVLCEIGISASRPYHKAEKPLGNLKIGETAKIRHRFKWFSLTEEQYLAVAPILFLVLQKITNERVAMQKHGFFSDDPFMIPVSNVYFSRSKKKLIKSVSKKMVPRGIKFAVSLKDQQIFRDVFWSELNSPLTRFRLAKKGRFLDLYLSWSSRGKHKDEEAVFKRREGNVWECLSNLPSHLLGELPACMPEKRNGNKRYIAGLIGANGETFEKKLANSALPNPETRLNGISVRITTGITGRDHIVFEVLPKYDS